MFEANAVYRQKKLASHAFSAAEMRRLEKRDALTYDILSQTTVPAVSRSVATLRRQSV